MPIPHIPRPLYWLSFAVLGLVLLYQWGTTIEDRTDPISAAEQSLFWKYLASNKAPSCERIKACRFSFERYGRFSLSKQMQVSVCDRNNENLLLLRRQLGARLEPSTCYVLPSVYGPVTVQKTLGINLNVEQALKAFRRERNAPGERVACEANGDLFDCYTSRRFFQRPIGPVTSLTAFNASR